MTALASEDSSSKNRILLRNGLITASLPGVAVIFMEPPEMIVPLKELSVIVPSEGLYVPILSTSGKPVEMLIA